MDFDGKRLDLLRIKVLKQSTNLEFCNAVKLGLGPELKQSKMFVGLDTYSSWASLLAEIENDWSGMIPRLYLDGQQNVIETHIKNLLGGWTPSKDDKSNIAYLIYFWLNEKGDDYEHLVKAIDAKRYELIEKRGPTKAEATDNKKTPDELENNVDSQQLGAFPETLASNIGSDHLNNPQVTAVYTQSRNNIKIALAGASMIVMCALLYITVTVRQILSDPIDIRLVPDPTSGILAPVFTSDEPFYRDATYSDSFLYNTGFTDRAKIYRNDIEDVTEAGVSDEELSWRYLLLGQALSVARSAESLTAYEKAVQYDPSSAAAYLGLGFAYLSQGRQKDALVQFTKAEPLVADGNDVETAIVKASKGFMLALFEDDLEAGISLTEEAIKAAKQANEQEYEAALSLQKINMIALAGDVGRAETFFNTFQERFGKCGELRFKVLKGDCFHTLFTIGHAMGLAFYAEEWSALAAYEEAGNQLSAIRSRNNLTEAVIDRDGLQAGEKWIKDTIELAIDRNYLEGQRHGLRNLSGFLGFHRQNQPEALKYAREEVDIARQLPNIDILAGALQWAASRANLVGDLNLANQYADEALGIADQRGSRLLAFQLNLTLLSIVVRQGDTALQEGYSQRLASTITQLLESKPASDEVVKYAEILTGTKIPEEKELWKYVFSAAARERNHKNAQRALAMLSVSGGISEKLEYSLERLAYVKENNIEKSRPDALRDVGSAYALTNDIENAIKFFNLSAEASRNLGEKIPIILAFDFLSLADSGAQLKILEPYYQMAKVHPFNEIPGYSLRSQLHSLAKAALKFDEPDVARSAIDKIFEDATKTGRPPDHLHYLTALRISLEQGDKKFLESFFADLKKTTIEQDRSFSELRSFDGLINGLDLNTATAEEILDVAWLQYRYDDYEVAATYAKSALVKLLKTNEEPTCEQYEIMALTALRGDISFAVKLHEAFRLSSSPAQCSWLPNFYSTMEPVMQQIPGYQQDSQQ